MRDFIIEYQFNYRTLNDEIFLIFDKLKSKIQDDDIIWKKALTEIDARNHEFGAYDEKLGGFPIQPKYDEQVNDFLNANKENFEAQNASEYYSTIISSAYKNEKQITYETWKECFDYYAKANLDYAYDRPVSLAVLGLKNFETDLQNNQKEWCLKTIIQPAIAIIQDSFSQSYNSILPYNIVEKDIFLESFHLVLDNLESDEDENDIISIMISLLFALYNPEIDKVADYIRNVFFNSHPREAQRVWIGLIKYAQFRNSNPRERYVDIDYEKKIEEAKKKEQEFIQCLSSTDDLSLDVSSITLKEYDVYLLTRAFIMTPYSSNMDIYYDFVYHLISLITENLKEDENYSYEQNSKKRYILHEFKRNIELYLVELLLYAKLEFTGKVIDLLIASVYSENFEHSRYGRGYLFDFVSNILENIIYEVKKLTFNSSDEDEILINNFWNVWEYLFERIKDSDKQYFVSILLLDIEWNEDTSHWKVLEHKKDFYYQMVLAFGANYPGSIINLFSTVGDRTFLPAGLSWLTEILKKNPSEEICLTSASSERLIRRLFYNHILTIKNDKQLIDDYIWMLNKMIDLGSSEAYLFRENVITYKVNQ